METEQTELTGPFLSFKHIKYLRRQRHLMEQSVQEQYNEHVLRFLYRENGEQDDRINVFECVFACGTAMRVCVHFLSSTEHRTWHCELSTD